MADHLRLVLKIGEDNPASVQKSFLNLIRTFEGFRPAPLVTTLNVQQGILQVDYPIDLFEPGNLGQQLSLITSGEHFLSASVLQITWPEGLKKSWQKPMGIKKIREGIGIRNRPLTSAVLSLKHGKRIEDCVEQAYHLWTAGVDLVMDPAILTSLPHNQFAERLELLSKEQKNCSERLKNPKCYAPNITARTIFEMERRIEKATDHGITHVFANALELGLGTTATLKEICTERHLTLLASLKPFSLGGYSFSEQVVASFFTSLGMDVLELPFSSEQLHVMLKDVSPTLPLVSGLKNLREIEEIIRLFGHDLILEGSSLIKDHPDGIKAGAEAFHKKVLSVS